MVQAYSSAGSNVDSSSYIIPKGGEYQGGSSAGFHAFMYAEDIPGAAKEPGSSDSILHGDTCKVGGSIYSEASLPSNSHEYY